MTRNEYLKQREVYQQKALDVFQIVNHQAYYAGVVRGLDLAFDKDKEGEGE